MRLSRCANVALFRQRSTSQQLTGCARVGWCCRLMRSGPKPPVPCRRRSWTIRSCDSTCWPEFRRCSCMHIARITPFLVDFGDSKSWLFVKLDTEDGLIGWGEADDGLSGWGEAYTQADRDMAMLAHVQGMGRYLIGRDAFAIKHFTSVMHLDYALRRPAVDWYSALSAIEQAMWDLVGKSCGQPVYNLLGGPCRERVRVYANGWSEAAKEPEEYARLAAETVARG